MMKQKDERKYFSHMSEAYAQMARGNAQVMHRDLNNIPDNGIVSSVPPRCNFQFIPLTPFWKSRGGFRVMTTRYHDKYVSMK